MAHAGTPTDLAKQPATSTINGLWRALLAAVVLFALVASVVFVGTNLAPKASVAPADDHRFDQMEQLRGTFLAPANNIYNQVEQSRNGTSLVPAVHYPDVSYEQNKPAPSRISGTAPYPHPGLVKGHRGAMIDQ